jgi:hypothetical protein
MSNDQGWRSAIEIRAALPPRPMALPKSLKRRKASLASFRLGQSGTGSVSHRADKGVRAMSSSKTARLGSVTGRDEFIIGEALATALIALEQLPEVRQPTRNMADMKMLLNSLYAPPEVSLHLTTARWRFIPSSRPFGARDVERGER